MRKAGTAVAQVVTGEAAVLEVPCARPSRLVALGISPELAPWGTGLEMSWLTEQTAQTVRRYLARLPELAPPAAARNPPAVPVPPVGRDAWIPGPGAAECEEESPHQQPAAGGLSGFVAPV